MLRLRMSSQTIANAMLAAVLISAVKPSSNMATFGNVETGTIALIQQDNEGRILQIGLTKEQSQMLQIFLSSISKDSPLVKMGEDYELVLKSSLKEKTMKNTFTCQACKHRLPVDFQVRTEGFCYLCDPKITVKELLSDEPFVK